jgi:hypothetical protein
VYYLQNKKFHKGECFFKNKPDAFTPSKKKKRKVTIAGSEDDEENNFQMNDNDVEGCNSDDEETRVAMCEILGGMSLSSKKNN